MSKLVVFAAIAGLFAVSGAEAGVRLQHYVPELKGMEKPKPDPKEKLEAFIFTPNGVTCNLPSKEGYCTVPITWMTTKDQQVSLWRKDAGTSIRVAYAYDGQNNAYLTFGKKLTYELHDGSRVTDRKLDSVDVQALWDDSWATHPPVTGELTAENQGKCSLYSGESSCEVMLRWATSNTSAASVWQRTQAGLVPLIKNVKAGSIAASGYSYPAVYELREGSEVTGALLSSVMTQGVPAKTAGKLTLPDGDTCLVQADELSCQLRVSWEGSDIGRLWIRDQSQSSPRLSGQALINIPLGGATVDLRASSRGSGPIMDRVQVKAEKSPYTGRIRLVEPSPCMILYAADSCEQTLYFRTDAPEGKVFDEAGRIISTAAEGTFPSNATERGVSYVMRVGNDPKSPPVASFISSGIKQTYTGTLSTNGATQCVFNYQRGTCALKLDYTATDNSSIWNAQSASRQGGGGVGGTVTVLVSNFDGAQASQNNFDLRFHGAQSPSLSNPLLQSQVLTGVRPQHTGKLSTSSSLCNMIYSRKACEISLGITSSSPLVSLWDDQGLKVWSGAPGTTQTVTVPEGKHRYALREGDNALNDPLVETDLTANRPTYYQKLSISASECVTPMYGAACQLQVTTVGNTGATVWYYTEGQQNNRISSVSGSGALKGNLAISSNKRLDQRWKVEVRQGSSFSGELLDESWVTAKANAPFTFKLTQSIPGDASAGVCAAYDNSDRCFGVWNPKWISAAPTVSACLYTKTGALYYNNYSSAGAIVGNLTYYKSSERYEQRFYEGNGCGAPEALLYSELLPAIKNISPEEYGFRLDQESYSCEMPYVGKGSCTVYPKVVVDKIEAQQGAYPRAYFYNPATKEASGSWSLTQTSTSMSATVREDVTDQTIQLKIIKGAGPELSDPVLDTAAVSHTKANVSAFAFAARKAIPNTGYFNTDKVSESDPNGVFFTRSKSGDKWSAPAPCLLNSEASTCLLYFWTRVGPSSSQIASIFIDGSYKTSMSGIDYAPGPYALAAGEHSIEFREGQGESSKNNKLLDGYSFIVKRPDSGYYGTIVLPEQIPTPTFYNNVAAFRYTFRSNTSGYVYDRKTGSLICSYAGQVTATESTTSETYCSQNLKEGSYTYDLYSERSLSSTTNKLLDTRSFAVERRQNNASVRKNANYGDTFDTCMLPYEKNNSAGCRVWFDWKLGSGDVGVVSGMACSYGTDGSLKGYSGLSYKTDWQAGYIVVARGAKTISIVDGASCPADSATAKPLTLTQWEITLTDPNPYGTINLSGSKVEDLGSGRYSCTQSYYDQTCGFSVTTDTYPKAAPGYYSYPTRTVMYRDGSLANSESALSEKYTTSLALNYKQKSAEVASVICTLAGNKDSINCPMQSDTILAKAEISLVTPNFTGKIQLPDGGFCEAPYGGSGCTLRIGALSDSSYITLYRDGALIASGNRSILDTFSLPVKPDGIRTKLSLYDGSSSQSGRLIDEVEVWAKKQDPAEFKFGEIKAYSYGKSSKNICYVSSLIASEIPSNCYYEVEYSGDISEKILKSSGGAADTVDNTTVSGNGSIKGLHSVWQSESDYTAYHNGNFGRTTLSAYRSDGKFLLGTSSVISFGLTAFGNSYFSTPWSNYGKPGNTRGWYGRDYWNGYSDNGRNYIYVTSTTLKADGIDLRSSSRCATDPFWSCGRIVYDTLSISLGTGLQTEFGITTSAAVETRKVFYKVRSISDQQKAQTIDPQISVSGVTRPINIDGEWHVLDMTKSPIPENSKITFSASNAGSPYTLYMDYFTETAPYP